VGIASERRRRKVGRRNREESVVSMEVGERESERRGDAKRRQLETIKIEAATHDTNWGLTIVLTVRQGTPLSFHLHLSNCIGRRLFEWRWMAGSVRDQSKTLR
jgi:hypothetical protein